MRAHVVPKTRTETSDAHVNTLTLEALPDIIDSVRQYITQKWRRREKDYMNRDSRLKIACLYAREHIVLRLN